MTLVTLPAPSVTPPARPVYTPAPGTCECCTAGDARLYLCGWRCDTHSPGASRATAHIAEEGTNP